MDIYVQSWWTFISQEQIPDVIKIHASELRGPNTVPGKTQSYPIFFHMIFPLDSVHAWSLWLLCPCWGFSPLTGHKDLSWSVSFLPLFMSMHTSLSSLRPAPLSSLPQVPCGMDELEGWLGLARFSELGQQNCLLLPLLPIWWFCVCIRKSEGCMRYLHDGIYWYSLLFIVHKISDVQLLCRQFYTTEFAHGLTASAP